MNNIKIVSKSLEDTRKISSIIAKLIDENNGGVIFLNGDLGAGKTTFTQFFAKELGIEDIVTSPTFNIFKRYSSKSGKNLNHFDLYRILSNVYEQGFEEYWFSNDFTIIEWANYLPDEFQEIYYMKINITIEDDNRVFFIQYNDNDEKIKEAFHEYIY